MENADKIQLGNFMFEIVSKPPEGYDIWNIGSNMPEGYVPFCKMKKEQPFEGARSVDLDSLKAVRTSYAGEILDGACVCTNIKGMEKYAREHRNAVPGTIGYRLLERVSTALAAMSELGWR